VTDEKAAYLALTQVPGMGVARLNTLLSAFSTASGAHAAPFEFLCTLPGFNGALVSALKSTPLSSGRKILDDADRLGVEVLLRDHGTYPELLTKIPEPPPVLFAFGRQEILSRPAVAIVGSRDHSAYGAAVCRNLAGAAARAGIVVVSGMARGLDAVAHAAALDAGGTTIGVLGNGHGVIYPAANRALYERVAREGLLLTEFPPGERPRVCNFPRRNRLISGLSRVTVVIEAAIGSGALITANTALDQGREVMAVPGNITSPVSAGTNGLIRDGATPVLEARDLLQHFPDLPQTDPPEGLFPNLQELPEDLSPEERQLASLVGMEPVHPDQLAQRCARPVAEILGILSGLEIAGVVEQGPGRVFRRC
jgi:DNA processing protein